MRYKIRLTGISLVVGLISCSETVEARDAGEPSDPALVLHYRFDEDPEKVAKDLSSHGHDGTIIKAQYLEQFNGRRGVLRFDGKDSMLHCPNTDMTFEMWVRFNRMVGDSRGMLFGDLNNFGFHVNYWNTLTLHYSRFNPEWDTHESMSVAVKRNLMSDRWSHLAVVVGGGADPLL